MQNVSILTMDGAGKVPKMQATIRLWNIVALNRAGRQLLTASSPIPDGLWPLVLERAGKYRTYQDIHSLCNDWYVRYSGVFFMLRNCPKLFSFRCKG